MRPQTDGIDLRSYIASVNKIKQNHQVFLKENPTSILHCNNPNILLLWKASAKQKDDSVLVRVGEFEEINAWKGEQGG